MPDLGPADTPHPTPVFDVSRQSGVLTVTGPAFELEVDGNAGTFSVRDLVHGTRLEHLFSALQVDAGGGFVTDGIRGNALECTESGSDVDQVVLECVGHTSSSVEVSLRFQSRAQRPEVLGLSVVFRNVSGGPLSVRQVWPFLGAAAEGSTLLFGSDPARCRVLQNGSDELVDFYVDVVPANKPLLPPEATILLNPYSSYSNGDALLYDLDSGASLLAGFTRLDWAVPLISVAGSKEPPDAVEGRIPLSQVAGSARFAEPVKLSAGKSIDGGTAVLVLGASTPFDALETYADEVALQQDIHLPQAPLSGWDSWYTGVGSDISQEFIQANAEGLSDLFLDHGLSSMQVDSGWEDMWGDWNAGSSFPSGMGSLAAYIRERGLTPEIWIAPLSADESSEFYQQHEDWFMPKGMYGQLLIPKEQHALDLSKAEVLARVEELAERVKGWGFGSVKMDFAYYALMSDTKPDVAKTAVALYRNAVKVFRETLGPEVYLTNIAMVFPNYGLVDGFRIGLDDWPCWDGGGCGKYPAGKGINAQGVKPAVRMAARRYWMNGRIWWNHHDQVFFRDLTGDEARAFLTYAALSGGMLSLGETTDSLTPEHASLFRLLVPLTGLTARPLDLFAREYPEVWHLRIRSSDETADLVGLFHWGSNRDLSVLPYAERADGDTVTHSVPLASLGLDPSHAYVAHEFWTGQTLAVEDGVLSTQLAPHTVKLFKLVDRALAPVFLATDRHLLMGPGIVTAVERDDAEHTLNATVRVVGGFPQTLRFFVPQDVQEVECFVDGVAVETTSEATAGGAVLELPVEAESSGDVGVEVRY